MATSFWQLIQTHKIVIPKLQRDYAQGRDSSKIAAIRENILTAICDALQGKTKPLELDFIYGYTNQSKNAEKERKIFYPLDGQQRLTTLFLLHWYIAAKEGYGEVAAPVLAKFTYETRHSSGLFCSELVNYQPQSFSESIRSDIINQPWFFTAWENDPTIRSMLIMLDAIQIKVSAYHLAKVWPLLTAAKAPVFFYLLPMEQLGLPDDLYIKMNSRGKELTEFEYFKIRFAELLSQNSKKFTVDPAKTFTRKADLDWSDLFWNLYRQDELTDIAKQVDEGFLRFFRYITDLIVVKSNRSQEESAEEWQLFAQVYAVKENVEFLFAVLDAFVALEQRDTVFFTSLFTVETAAEAGGKTRLFFFNADANLLKKCANVYDTEERSNPFSMGEQLMLYGCIVHLLQATVQFKVRIRKLRNLIANSEDTMRKENLAALLNSVAELISTDHLSAETKFNTRQIAEENEKATLIKQHPKLAKQVSHLEDHPLLQGALAIFKLAPDLGEYAKQFERLFARDCNYDTISCALLTFADYSQAVGKTRRFGNKREYVWRELFSRSQRRGDYENTQKVLYKLLNALRANPNLTAEEVVNAYLAAFAQNPKKEKDWRYYFIKHSEFRSFMEGYYAWNDAAKPYECMMLNKKTMDGSHWDPFLLTMKNKLGSLVTLDKKASPLKYLKGEIELQISNLNGGFQLQAVGPASHALLKKMSRSGVLTPEFFCKIKQSAAGLDEEDRIEKGIRLIESLKKL